MKIVNGVFDYKVDAYSGRLSSCYLRVYQLADRVALVIATELAENKGPSVTNSVEAWASEAVIEYDLDPARTYFVEHYDRRKGGSYGASVAELEEETYDFVEFQWVDVDDRPRALSPKWRRGTREEIEKLVSQSLDE